MRPAAALATVTVLLASSIALAHGGGEHVKGTVKALEEKGLVVETSQGKRVQVLFDAKTIFERAGAPSTAAELHAGDRAVVHCLNAHGSPCKAALVKSAPGSKESPSNEKSRPEGHESER